MCLPAFGVTSASTHPRYASKNPLARPFSLSFSLVSETILLTVNFSISRVQFTVISIVYTESNTCVKCRKIFRFSITELGKRMAKIFRESSINPPFIRDKRFSVTTPPKSPINSLYFRSKNNHRTDFSSWRKRYPGEISRWNFLKDDLFVKARWKSRHKHRLFGFPLKNRPRYHGKGEKKISSRNRFLVPAFSSSFRNG